jgi:hypothetical protein
MDSPPGKIRYVLVWTTKKHTYREGNTMIVLTITPRKKRLRDFFIKPEPQRHFFNYEFPKEAKTTNEPTNRDA